MLTGVRMRSIGEIALAPAPGLTLPDGAQLQHPRHRLTFNLPPDERVERMQGLAEETECKAHVLLDPAVATTRDPLSPPPATALVNRHHHRPGMLGGKGSE
jgi:hypothetical protein